MLKNHGRTIFAAIGCLAVLSGCGPQAGVSLPGAEDAVFRFGFRNMAWDGQRLWQYVRDKVDAHLRAYNLKAQLVRKIPLTAEAIPAHKSFEWAQDSFWLLDARNTLYRLSPAGQLLAKVPLSGFSGPATASLMAWQGDQLWVFRKGFYDVKAARDVPPALMRLDPASGAPLRSEPLSDPALANTPFEDMVIQDGTFYLGRSHMFAPQENVVWQIRLDPLQVEKRVLPRVYTGLGTLVFLQGKLYGMELKEFINCQDACPGLLREVPLTGAAP